MIFCVSLIKLTFYHVSTRKLLKCSTDRTKRWESNDDVAECFKNRPFLLTFLSHAREKRQNPNTISRKSHTLSQRPNSETKTGYTRNEKVIKINWISAANSWKILNLDGDHNEKFVSTLIDRMQRVNRNPMTSNIMHTKWRGNLSKI